MGLDTLDVTIAKIAHHAVSKGSEGGNKFLIARTSTGLTIKGPLLKAIVGERYRLWGYLRAQKPYKGKIEDAFEFESAEVIIDQSEAGQANYLRNYVDGLGWVKSQRLVDRFGADTLTILRTDPARALEVEGISQELVDGITKHFEETTFDPVAYSRLVDMFSEYKIPAKIIKRLVKDFGSSAPDFVTENPYRLMAFPRLGWKLVDGFATSKAIGYPPDGLERHKAAIVEALEQISGKGHTYASRVDIESVVFQMLGMRPRAEAYDSAAEDGSLVAHMTAEWEKIFALPKLWHAENTIAERLATLARTASPLPFSLPDDGLLEGQREALRLIEQEGVVIIAGAPGTGKTYTVMQMLTGLMSQGCGAIKVVAPTGKAAKRAAELIQRALPGCPIEPSTIHRALGPVPNTEPEGVPKDVAKMGRGREEFMFSHGPSDPINARIIVTDEESMVDVKLKASLVGAVANGSRLIIVGDPNQLPSVGPGSVLRDMIAGGVPTATLTEIQRNSGRIVRACHSILKGEVPRPAPKVDLAAGENWIHLEVSDPFAINAQIVALHESARKNKRFDPLWDMQVISPEIRKPGIGCEDLNRSLAALLNPYKNPQPIGADDTGKRPAFELGDKVIRTKNGLCDLMVQGISDSNTHTKIVMWEEVRYGLVETDIVNGDMGIVRDIQQQGDNWYVIVQFVNPDRLCRLSYGDSHLIQAYAITCHKAQGSGFPYVIVPAHNSFYMWNREMVYTLISRAEKLLVTVGQFSAIEAAIGRKTVDVRKTRLRGLIESSFANLPGKPEPSEEFANVEG